MWSGALTPSMQKHHMRARIRDRVSVRRNPVTEEDFDSPQQYYKVDVWWPPNPKVYVYLVAAAVAMAAVEESQEETIEDILNQELTEDEVESIMNAVKEFTKNPVAGGRDWREYLTDEELKRQIDKGEAVAIGLALGSPSFWDSTFA